MTNADPTAAEADDVRRWAVHFNAARPPSGRFSDDIAAAAGPIPSGGAAAHRVALDYFESKLPAALTRYQHAVAAEDPTSVPEDWFNAVGYWQAVIRWFSSLNHPAEVAAGWQIPKPSWFFPRDRVELDRDVKLDGQLLREGTPGEVMEGLDDGTFRKFAAQNRLAVMFTGDNLAVLPVFLLRYQPGCDERPEASRPSSPGREGCGHSWTRAGYSWKPVAPERGGRPFACRYYCRVCGSFKLEDFDEYSGRDLDIVHLKWRGSVCG